jgi:hypothetical protein
MFAIAPVMFHVEHCPALAASLLVESQIVPRGTANLGEELAGLKLALVPTTLATEGLSLHSPAYITLKAATLLHFYHLGSKSK